MDKHTPNTLDGASMAISEQRKQELKQLFPGVFTETRNDAGELVETIDFERLKAELGQFSEIYDNRRERYGMDWPGKRDSLRLIQQPSHATLKPCREESVDFDSTENLFIEGDNLEVLKLLQKSYYGQVKMIYIDPPYNTGKEFIYPDNFSESLDTYLQYAGLKDSQGRTFSTNTANEGRFHTKWLNMMFPRLYLARNLLREDGVIFISIDDNEVENLRRMCDEIFGGENFIANIVWQKKQSPQNDATNLSTMHDHVLVYARQARLSETDMKGWKRNLLPRSEEQEARYKNPDQDERGEWTSSDLTCNKTADQRPNLYYAIKNPKTGEMIFPSKTRVWGYERELMESFIADRRVYWGNDGSGTPRLKKFRSEVDEGVVPSTWWSRSKAGDNQEGKREIRALFPEGDVFDTPKPTKLIDYMLQIACPPNEDCLVLDFFAGSSSTAHAVLKRNLSVNGRLNFISIQLPEPIDPGSSAHRLGFKNISEISQERIRRAIKELEKKAESGKETSGSTKDLGFKVLKLNQSNFKPWRAPDKSISDTELLQQMELSVDHVDPNASQEDLLYELLLKAGVKPTEKIDVISLAGHQLFAVGEGHLLVHLDNQIDQGLIDAVLQQAPSQFICLDKAFHGNDQLKTNAVRTFANFNDGKVGIERIDFKTV
tara:strand:- start:27825 stop:29801 length:1977 start_codon:yes stop_codon:yes gene_type:complete